MKYSLFWIAMAFFATISLVSRTVKSEKTTNDNRWYSNLSLVIHRNGEVDPCGATGMGFIDNDFVKNLSTASDKYEMETRLTDSIAKILKKQASTSKCGREKDDYENKSNFYRHCDRGPKRTPILLDHQELVKTATATLPCRFYTREGLRIKNLEQLKTMVEKANAVPTQSCANPQDSNDAPKNCETPEINLYAVPAGRVFHFAPAFVGETFELNHLTLLPDETKPIILKVLSLSPKVFDILDVFTEEEAEELVKRALTETSPTHRMKRSTTGSSGRNTLFTKRTSENGFDTHGEVSLALKKRIFEVLGYDEYWEGHDDGLQVLRYNLTQAYTPHLDYIPLHTKSTFDYSSDQKGGNRYATVLLYMTDIPEGGGGETVFSKSSEGEMQSHEDALKELRVSGDAERAGIVKGSWEEEMVATCRSRFSIRPHAGRAVLFYSQLPNGEVDLMSWHGGCPVLKGDKWAANLWVWNTPRQDFIGAPLKDGVTTEDLKATNKAQADQLKAVFKNSGEDPSMKNAELYYEAGFWGKFGHGDKEMVANTFQGHKWNVKVDGNVVKTWVISAEPYQVFTI